MQFISYKAGAKLGLKGPTEKVGMGPTKVPKTQEYSNNVDNICHVEEILYIKS